VVGPRGPHGVPQELVGDAGAREGDAAQVAVGEGLAQALGDGAKAVAARGGHEAAGRGRRGRRGGLERAEPLQVEVAQVPVVAPEGLVAGVAREHHLDVLAGQLRDEVGRDGRGVGEGLVEVPDEVLQELDGIGLDDELAVLRAEVLRDAARVGQLVVLRLAEADRERLHRLAEVARHERDDDARVEAAAQERPKGTSATSRLATASSSRRASSRSASPR